MAASFSNCLLIKERIVFVFHVLNRRASRPFREAVRPNMVWWDHPTKERKTSLEAACLYAVHDLFPIEREEREERFLDNLDFFDFFDLDLDLVVDE